MKQNIHWNPDDMTDKQKELVKEGYLKEFPKNPKKSKHNKCFIKFVIEGEPVAKSRPKFNSKTGHTYTPAKTKKAEENFLKQSLQYKPKEPLTSYLSVSLIFYQGIPLSRPKKWRELADKGVERPTRNDLDNLEKLCLDAMNKIFYTDDRLIVKMTTEKFYGEPRTEVTIEEL